MSSVAGTFTPKHYCHSISLCRLHKNIFPVDYYLEIPIDRLPADARTVYLADVNDPESVRCLNHGKHQIDGGRQMVVLESGDRLFIAPVCDCVLEYSAGQAWLTDLDQDIDTVAVGVKKLQGPAIETGPGIEALFYAISRICSGPIETSPYRSHPLFRGHPAGIRLSRESPGSPPASRKSPIRMQLPPDLRYLFAAAPLAYYLGASVRTGDGPGIEARGRFIDLPSGHVQFERWAGKMLSYTFQTDCAVRCEAVTGNRLPGIDVRSITGYAPEELMLMAMPDRLQLYTETLPSSRRVFNAWHMASYLEPVPDSVEILPFLMRSLSAIYAPRSTRLSERNVVSLSVRHYKKQHTCLIRGDDGPIPDIVLPSLYDAQTQHWYSEGCPVDAALSDPGAMKNGRNYARSRLMPEICIICNEASMAREAQLLEGLLDGIAHVDVRMGLGCKDLLHTFSEGFDIVHFAGHCDGRGLQCRDGPADLSSVGTCNVPVFFLNSCSSHVQGTRLIERGAVCGITTMFRLLDEAAVDVSAGFYRMLARGYPIMTSYLGARECSAAGKEYLLIGDGFYRVFNGSSSFLPFYTLSRNGSGFSVRCRMPGGDKGLIIRTGNGHAMADTGFDLSGLRLEDMRELGAGPDGMCLYGTSIYDCVADAVSAALIDMTRTLAVPRPDAMVPGRRRNMP